jgi:hypothetical protein
VHNDATNCRDTVEYESLLNGTSVSLSFIDNFDATSLRPHLDVDVIHLSTNINLWTAVPGAPLCQNEHRTERSGSVWDNCGVGCTFNTLFRFSDATARALEHYYSQTGELRRPMIALHLRHGGAEMYDPVRHQECDLLRFVRQSRELYHRS